MRKFTPDEDWIIEQLYEVMPANRIRLLLGRPKGAVKQRMKRLNLTPNIDFKRNSFFYSGRTPWNKGTKGLTSANSTSFKKGNKPFNTKENGVISLRKDSSGKNYKYIRISEGKWELYHRVLWKKEYGEIPKNMLIVFKDGNSLNCSIENLEMISKAENMSRNSIVRYSPDMRKAIRLTNKIKKYAEKHNNGSEQHAVRTA